MQSLIRRYNNRKFYDTRQSKYVSLRDIYDMYVAGVPIAIVNNRNEDITQWTLYQAVTRTINPQMRQKVLELVKASA